MVDPLLLQPLLQLTALLRLQLTLLFPLSLLLVFGINRPLGLLKVATELNGSVP